MIRPLLYGTAFLTTFSSFCYSSTAHAADHFPDWMNQPVGVSAPAAQHNRYGQPRRHLIKPSSQYTQRPTQAVQKVAWQPPASVHKVKQKKKPYFRHANYLRPSKFPRPRGQAFKTPPLAMNNAPRPLEQSGQCSATQPAQLQNHCIKRSNSTRQGLNDLATYLKRRSPQVMHGKAWARVSNGHLLGTVNKLLAWHDGQIKGALPQHFELRPVQAKASTRGADYTGYFTPLLEVKRSPDREFRIPIYRAPSGGTTLSHAAISGGALKGKGLEVAWTNDPVNLYFAQVQGSAVARFPDGREAVLAYNGNNGHKFQSIAGYLKKRGYKTSGFGNNHLREWFKANPSKTAEVMASNPRFVFFDLKNHAPKTASGAHVIPGHTIAVDDNYIPLGSVLLAEVPRIDSQGRTVGNDWRLLFAQDRGNAIKGAGRIDLYTGAGESAETLAHRLTGYRTTYLLLDRPSQMATLSRR